MQWSEGLTGTTRLRFRLNINLEFCISFCFKHSFVCYDINLIKLSNLKMHIDIMIKI